MTLDTPGIPSQDRATREGGARDRGPRPRSRFSERDQIMRMDIKTRIMAAAPGAWDATAPVGVDTASPDAYCAEEYWTNTAVSYSGFQQSHSSYSSTTGGPGITWSVQVNRTYGVSGELSGDGSAILAGASARESAPAFPPPTRSAGRGVAGCSTGTAMSSLFMAVPLHCPAWPSTSSISGCGEGVRAGSQTLHPGAADDSPSFLESQE